MKPKLQLWVHLGLLTASLATLPIIPSAYWKPTGGGDPTLSILLLLGATIGLPYMLLSSTSPLLQAWYVRVHHGAAAVSPVRAVQFRIVSGAAQLSVRDRAAADSQPPGHHLVLGVCRLRAGVRACGVDKQQGRYPLLPTEVRSSDCSRRLTVGTKIFWVALAACASTLLLATTSHLTQNVAPIPLLWVVPLSIYLLSFILCFESGRLYQRWIFMPLLVGSLGLFARGNSPV